VHADSSWRAREGQGFPPHDRGGNPAIHVTFPRAACLACAQRAHCTQAAAGPRALSLRPEAQHVALQAARQRQTTPEFKAQYAQRAGVEGTLSQGVRAFGLRRTRYIGLPKARLQHPATAAAINIARLDAWWTETPRAPTRQAAFARLVVAA